MQSDHPHSDLQASPTPDSQPDEATGADQLMRKHARALRDAGRLHLKQGNLDAAEECLGHTLATFRGLDAPDEIAETAELMAEVRSAQDATQPALDLLREALKARERCGDRRGLASTLLRIAQVHMRGRKMQLALEYLEQALDRVEPDDQATRGTILTRLATIYRNQGRNDEALAHCDEARELLAGIDRTALAECLNVMGTVLGQLERHDDAVATLEESLAARRQIGDAKGEAQTLNSLGIVLMQLDQNERSRASFEQALELCQRLGDTRWRGVTLNNLGVVAKRLGDVEAAAAYYREACDVAQALDDPYALALALRNLALVAYLRGDFAEADTHALAALRCCRQLDERQGETECLERLCLIALASGRTESAEERATELAHLGRGLDLPEVVRRQPYYRARIALVAGDERGAAAAAAEIPAAETDDVEQRAWATALLAIARSRERSGSEREDDHRTAELARRIHAAIDALDAHDLPHAGGVIALEALRWARLPEEAWRSLTARGSAIFEALGATGWLVQVHLAAGELLVPRDPGSAVARLKAALDLAESAGIDELADRVRLRLRSMSGESSTLPGLGRTLAAEMTLPRAKLEVLYELGRTVGTLLEARALAEALAGLAMDHLDAAACVVYLEQEARPSGLRLAAPAGEVMPEQLIPAPDLLRSLVARSITVGRRSVFAAAQRGDAHFGIGLPAGAELVCLAPLKMDRETLGILAAVFKHDRPWTGDDEQLLTAMANVAAPALHNARLVEELKSARDTLSAENRALREVVEERSSFDAFVGQSAPMQRLYDLLDKASHSNMTVLVRGENGTGKELAARSIHFRSTRQRGPFVKLNCAAIPESLVEAELFGVEGGTATGVQKRIGRFEQASGGTLLLDEIGDMPLSAQAKVLRALQEQEIERVGGRRPIAVDTRIIAATNRDLEQAIASHAFRRDLYYRLRVIEIQVPPLREHPEDIPLLAMHFLEQLCATEGKKVTGFDEATWSILTSHDWPGNVRELEHAIAHAVVLCEAERIRPTDLPSLLAPAAAAASGTLKEMVHAYERQILERALAQAGNRGMAARRLGIGRSTFYAKLKEHGLLDREQS